MWYQLQQPCFFLVIFKKYLTFFLMTLFSQHTHRSKYVGVLILRVFVSLLWAFLTNILWVAYKFVSTFLPFLTSNASTYKITNKTCFNIQSYIAKMLIHDQNLMLDCLICCKTLVKYLTISSNKHDLFNTLSMHKKLKASLVEIYHFPHLNRMNSFTWTIYRLLQKKKIVQIHTVEI